MVADVIFRDRTIPGDEMAARGLRTAGGFQALGLGSGDVVAVMLRNAPAYGDIMLACYTAGTYYLPVNWHFKAAEVGYLLRDSGAKLLIVHSDLLAEIAAEIPAGMPVLTVSPAPGTGSGSADFEVWRDKQAPYSGPQVAPRAHMAYTSGTTGRPKGVLRAPIPLDQVEAAMAAGRALTAAAFGVTAGARVLMPAPIYHSGPSLIARSSLLDAALLVLMERFDAEDVLAAIERHRIDTVYLVPIMYVRLLRLPEAVRQRYDLSSLRFVGSTGAPCAPEVKRAMIEWFGPIINECYASSEIGLLTLADSALARAKPGTAGRPLPGTRMKILKEDGSPCAPGEVGLIYAHQAAYPDFTYAHNDEARRKIERDGLCTLGDLGYLDADGCLFVCDRLADMVISGGVNIYPAEIEHALLEHPSVADCAVFGAPDPEFGERLVAMVQPVAGGARDVDVLADFLATRLADYKVPREILFDDNLPRDDNGKILKRKLRDARWAGQERRV